MKRPAAGLLVRLAPAANDFDLVSFAPNDYVFIVPTAGVTEKDNQPWFELRRVNKTTLQIRVGKDVAIDLVLIHELAEDRTAGEWVVYPIGRDDSLYFVLGNVRAVFQPCADGHVLSLVFSKGIEKYTALETWAAGKKLRIVRTTIDTGKDLGFDVLGLVYNPQTAATQCHSPCATPRRDPRHP